MLFSRCLILSCCLLAIGCSTYQPARVSNVCDIFWGETDWYKEAVKSNKRWGTPIHIMMAIINQESSFRAKVRPKRPKFLFIPLPRRSSAYGYAQAQDPAWNDYRNETGNWWHDRDDFGDAINLLAGTQIKVLRGWESPNGTPISNIWLTMRDGVVTLVEVLRKNRNFCGLQKKCKSKLQPTVRN